MWTQTTQSIQKKEQMTSLQNMFRFLRRQKFEILREDFLEELTSKWKVQNVKEFILGRGLAKSLELVRRA